ncbi:MAG: DNA polymerase ligase N-terminal domain-containing protein [Microthrixaceae bacterium]
MADERLDAYRNKRDFDRTAEPAGGAEAAPERDEESAARYSFQHHDASSEHWDLRLEHDGVLLSWAVTKGPSTDPRDKRLAIRTEDHPVDYLDFEGTIPQQEYGGGSVVVWDLGTWENLTEDGGEPVPVDEALDQGHLSFRLDGEKLTGAWTLQRFRDEDQWLLIKQRGEGADARRKPTSTEPESVVSGRTVAEVAEQAGPGRASPGPDDLVATASWVGTFRPPRSSLRIAGRLRRTGRW